MIVCCFCMAFKKQNIKNSLTYKNIQFLILRAFFCIVKKWHVFAVFKLRVPFDLYIYLTEVEVGNLVWGRDFPYEIFTKVSAEGPTTPGGSRPSETLFPAFLGVDFSEKIHKGFSLIFLGGNASQHLLGGVTNPPAPLCCSHCINLSTGRTRGDQTES